MRIWSEITFAKTLRYLFLQLTIGWSLLALLNLSACLGLFNEEAMMRGWVNFGFLPEASTLMSDTALMKAFQLGTQLQQEQDLTI